MLAPVFLDGAPIPERFFISNPFKWRNLKLVLPCIPFYTPSVTTGFNWC